VELTYLEVYADRGLDRSSLSRLSLFGDLLLSPGFNVTSVREPQAVEQFHFLDCLSLLDIPEVSSALNLVDIGSGAGLPALILALALPAATITAVESLNKKCVFIREAAGVMGLDNVDVRCVRAEEYGRGSGRGIHDVVVSRALAALPALAEYSLPLLHENGVMIAMKGDISTQERIQGQKALDILGGGPLESMRLQPFAGAENRWVHLAWKLRATPSSYPRRPGLAKQRPLGG